MVNTVTVAASEATVSMARIRRCATTLLIRSGETETVDGTVRRRELQFESDAALAFDDGDQFIFGC